MDLPFPRIFGVDDTQAVIAADLKHLEAGGKYDGRDR